MAASIRLSMPHSEKAPPRRVQPQETLLQLEILEAGIASLKASWQAAP